MTIRRVTNYLLYNTHRTPTTSLQKETTSKKGLTAITTTRSIHEIKIRPEQYAPVPPDRKGKLMSLEERNSLKLLANPEEDSSSSNKNLPLKSDEHWSAKHGSAISVYQDIDKALGYPAEPIAPPVFSINNDWSITTDKGMGWDVTEEEEEAEEDRKWKEYWAMKNVKCPHCNVVFETSTDFDKHMNRVHIYFGSWKYKQIGAVPEMIFLFSFILISMWYARSLIPRGANNDEVYD